jgi:hypothetical protein
MVVPNSLPLLVLLKMDKWIEGIRKAKNLKINIERRKKDAKRRIRNEGNHPVSMGRARFE